MKGRAQVASDVFDWLASLEPVSTIVDPSGVNDPDAPASRSSKNGSSALKRRLPRVACIAIGTSLTLGFVAVMLASVDFLASLVADDTTEEWVRDSVALLFALLAVSLVGMVVWIALAGMNPIRRVRGLRTAATLLEWVGSTAFWLVVALAALVGGGIALVVFIVGFTAAAAVLVYLIAELFTYLLGISLGWGWVITFVLIIVLAATGGLMHDIRLEVTAPRAPPKEHD